MFYCQRDTFDIFVMFGMPYLWELVLEENLLMIKSGRELINFTIQPSLLAVNTHFAQ